MNIHHLHFYFDKLKALDAVSVHIEAYPRDDQQNPMLNAPFHIDIRCYGEIWTTFFSGPSGTPTQFLRGCDVDYLVNRMHNLTHKTKASEKVERAYLRRIIEAIKSELMDDQEKQQQYCLDLIDQQKLELVDYRKPEQAPRFNQIVIVRFLGESQIYGPAPADRFNWNHGEGHPNIDQFWLVTGAPEDDQKTH
jgi:hypothetical protein